MAVREGCISPQGSNSETGQLDPGCPYHNGVVNYELENCNEFKEEILRMLSLKILRYQQKSKIEDEVNIARFGENMSSSAPRIVFSAPTTPTPLVTPLIVIQTPP